MEVERRNLFGRGTRRFLVKVLCDTLYAKERFEVLDDNKEMIKLIGGPLRVVMDETSHHQNTHWRESIQV